MEGERGSLEVGVAGDGDVGDAVAVVARATVCEELLELEAVGVALPTRAVRRDVLRGPTGVGAELIDDVRGGQVGVGEEEAFAGTIALRGRGGKVRTGESSKGIEEGIAIGHPATVEGVLVVEAVVHTDDVLAVVERIERLEDHIVRHGRVGKVGGLLLLKPVNVGDGASVRGNHGRDVVVGNGVFCAGIVELRAAEFSAEELGIG